MKKFLTIFSSVMCVFLTSSAYANPYQQSYSYSAEQYPSYADPCVGRCEDPCVGQCQRSCWDGRVYVGVFGGANWLNFDKIDHIHHKPKVDVGYAGALSLGYKFNSGFRVEGEVAYRHNHLKNQHFAHSYDSGKISGSTHSWSYMANFLYDFDGFSCYVPNVVPYVGAGIGYSQIHAHVKAHHGELHESAKGKDSGVAGQAIAGVSYRLTRDTSLGVEYRYFVGREHARDHSVGLALRQAF